MNGITYLNPGDDGQDLCFQDLLNTKRRISRDLPIVSRVTCTANEVHQPGSQFATPDWGNNAWQYVHRQVFRELWDGNDVACYHRGKRGTGAFLAHRVLGGMERYEF